MPIISLGLAVEDGKIRVGFSRGNAEEYLVAGKNTVDDLDSGDRREP
jgi:hypothetical protein